jgi:nicotinate phosphoribosyltransferase
VQLVGSERRSMNPATSVLLTDLYQLTMLQGYYDWRMEETATFEMFVRRLPPGRNFLLAAGLEQLLDYLENLRFDRQELDWLRGCGYFHHDFVESLSAFRFTGDVEAMAEGTVFFPEEPLVRVTAPLPQAQFIESRLINLLQFSTLIASKAARSLLVAPGKRLVDFGMRRSHGAEAALLAARASYLAGFAGSATVLAGPLFGIPVYGTMAHSFVLAHDNEVEAFEHFASANPNNVVLLIDTYDTEEAARRIVALAPRLTSQGIAIRGVRLDSGDLAEHARRVRRILDEGGLASVSIFVSGNLDEFALQDLIASHAPIDGFGIGTRLDVSADAPYLDSAYKLQEYAGRPKRKRSEGKATLPGRKQVYRRYDGGTMCQDVVTLEGIPERGDPLLHPAMRNGKRLLPRPKLAEIRRRAADSLAQLPSALKRLEQAAAYDVQISPSLSELARRVDLGES